MALSMVIACDLVLQNVLEMSPFLAFQNRRRPSSFLVSTLQVAPSSPVRPHGSHSHGCGIASGSALSTLSSTVSVGKWLERGRSAVGFLGDKRRLANAPWVNNALRHYSER